MGKKGDTVLIVVDAGPGTMSSEDTIRINDLLLTVPLSTGAIWPKPPGQAALQPVLVTLSISHNISSTASTDDLSHTINYSLLCSVLRESLNEKGPPLENLEQLSARIADILLGSNALLPSIGKAQLKVVQMRAPLNCKAIGLESMVMASHGSSWSFGRVKHIVENLECSTIIGVNACEREERQIVRVNLSIENMGPGMQHIDFRLLTQTLHEKIGNSAYQTLEALTSHIAEETLRHLATPNILPLVTVKASKPSAIVFASSSEIEISRTYADYPHLTSTEVKDVQNDSLHTVALALGSNLGDRFYNIELALRLLEAPGAILGPTNPDAIVFVVDTSFMYETAPMYVTDQPAFINCACMIETNLPPAQLLKLLKTIEVRVGRVPSMRNGPRAVDLDIILYDNLVIDTRSAPRKELDDLEGELVVPHPRLAEREFVLRPLNDMIPDLIHPQLHQSISALLAALPVPVDTAPMHKVIPFPQIPFVSDSNTFPAVAVVPPTQTYWEFTSFITPAARAHQTHVMATLNATPDSFSDGAVRNTLAKALKYADDAAAAGASIVDVGGYSTRPGAAFVSAEEEIARIAPCIAEIRKAHTSLPISVDTFRPEVARAAISVGANCINDVYAFTGRNSYPFPDASPSGDVSNRCMAEMKSLAREFAVPVVLMHSRGEAGSNKNYDAYWYAGETRQVVEGVRVELGAKVNLIVRGRGGLRRWLVIVDPGIGFSKSVDGNLEVLRDAASITADLSIGSGPNHKRNALAGYPQLIGASRKSFLGIILETGPRSRITEPRDRGWATAAAVACAVQQKALVVRVHDTREMLDVVQVANALW